MGFPQARILEWVVISFSREFSWLRGQTHVSCLTGRFFTTEPPGKPKWVANHHQIYGILSISLQILLDKYQVRYCFLICRKYTFESISIWQLWESLCNLIISWSLSTNLDVQFSPSVVSDSCDPMDCSPPGSSVHGISPGKNTGVGSHFLLQGMFPTQGSNPHLLHCQADRDSWLISNAHL